MKAMNVDKNNLMLINSAIAHFVGEPVSDISRFDDSVVFQTLNGSMGFIEPNFVGNWDIWIGEEIVYEIEKELFELIEYDRSDSSGLIKFYDQLKEVDTSVMKYKSRTFFDIIKSSVENLLLNHNLPINGGAKIGTFEVCYTNNKKFKINLN